jgi:hypothetical protein
VKERAREERGERRERYNFFIKIKYWEATVLLNTLGSTVATQPKCVKLG